MTRPATKPKAPTPAPVVVPVTEAEAPAFSVSAACLRHCARMIHEDATTTGEAGPEVCREMIAFAAHLRELADEIPTGEVSR